MTDQFDSRDVVINSLLSYNVLKNSKNFTYGVTVSL